MAPSSARPNAQERLSEIGKAVRSDGGLPTEQSALLVRLAASLGLDPKTLALRMEGETVRKTKYPVIEEHHRGGKISFKHRVMA